MIDARARKEMAGVGEERDTGMDSEEEGHGYMLYMQRDIRCAISEHQQREGSSCISPDKGLPRLTI